MDFTTFKHCVNGELVDTKQHRHGINPANLKNLPDVPVATEEDLDTAVAAARVAFESWSKVSWELRKKTLLEFIDALEAKKDEFTKLLTTEQGKPTFQAVREHSDSVSIGRSTANLTLPEEVIEDSEDRKITTRFTPLGVVAGIVPWNFPILLAMMKIAPAVLTGNVIIIKPSPFTPYGDLKLVELAQNFFPPGVVQSLSGDDNLGPWITSHPGINKISFTGSTQTGKLVAASAAKTLKRVTLELGGNDAAIICADVNIEKVAPQVATFAFLNSGQICLCIKRIYIHKSIYRPFLEALIRHAKTLQVGDGFAPDTFCGPIQNSMQYERVKGFFSEIEKEKWNVACGGKMEKTNGYFITPTIIDNPADDARIVTEEPFGPIVPTLSWESEDEVIERANTTNMGLGASVWSSDFENAGKIARQLEAGTVWVNNHFDLSPMASFGGFKESGLGVEMGIGGLKAMCNSQTLMINKKA
ncbi:related to aldehyde dehydrogenase (NAD+), mitochondrial [Rhynchosporium graminicola]|uniref:aldehyde dehydrogenase (NAD(+)) n=1 Tax=Rhynchosporium graminicola TaxID=2792576 RepID=A0A1E1LGM1_9HELO|nr:related to aldehyde dehydrogenase (NAD+), mitochondrial [Rhynchosporium commune]